MNYEDEIHFVTSHYKEGRFNTSEALRQIRPTAVGWWAATRIAAAVAVLVVVSATAAIFVHENYFAAEPQPVEQQQPMAVDLKAVKVIDFEDAPLPVVVEKVKEVYGVNVVNIPENAEDYKLSLHYEGNAADLIETINDILGTEMDIEQ